MSERGAKGALGRLWGVEACERGARTRCSRGDARQAGRLLRPASSRAWARPRSKLSDGIGGLFTKRKLSGETLDDLEDVLIEADLGLDTAERIIATLRKGRYEKGIGEDDVRAVLKAEVERVLAPVARPLEVDAALKPYVILVVGVNGTGKTTTIGKLAAQFPSRGQKRDARGRRHLPRRRHRSAEDLGRAHRLRGGRGCGRCRRRGSRLRCR